MCATEAVKVDGLNICRLVLPVKCYLTEVRDYLRQWKPVHGSETFMRLVELSSEVAEHVTYDIGRIANQDNINDQVWNKTQEP